MKEQYVGDVNDYRKYALLRALSGNDHLKIGICWMLTPADGSSDGDMRDYLGQPDVWRPYDPELFDVLKRSVRERHASRLRFVEDSGIIESALYFNDCLSDEREARQQYFDRALANFTAVDLVFFDPDNGLDVPSRPMGRKHSSKYVYRDEIRRAYHEDHSILVYQHFTREERSAFIARIGADLAEATDCSEIWCFRSPYVAFFLLIHPHHMPPLAENAANASRMWGEEFLVGSAVIVA